MNIYEATFMRGIDGDTTVFELKKTTVEFGRRVTKINHNITVRFLGINTPERGQAGYYDAKGHTWYRLDEATKITVETDDTVDVFNRLLGTVFVDGVNLNKELLNLGLAEVYVK